MKHKNSQSGFTLIEISIVLLILGMVTGAFFAFYTPMLDLKYRESTQEKQKIIVRALANYAQQYGRLPCAADPNPTPASDLGLERSGANACDSPAERNGIIPYRTLGLSQDDILDGWKRPFTYVVDQKATGPNNTKVHTECRKAVWFSSSNNDNPTKATFCCQLNEDRNDRLEVFIDPNMTNDENLEFDTVLQNSPSSSDFGNVNTEVTSTPIPLGYFPFALISHGKNGMGSYVIFQTARTSMPPTTALEYENANDDDNIFKLPFSTVVGDDYFDDMVVTRTQQSLISEFGNDNCNTP